MQYYQNQACLSYKEMSVILTKPLYDAYKNRNKIAVLQKGGNGREALIAYDSLPAELKAKVRQVYGDDIKAKALQSPLLKYYEIDVKASDFYSTYQLPNGKYLTEEQQRKYTSNASTLNAIIRLMEANRTMRRSMGGKVKVGKVFQEFILPSLKALKEQWGHTLPKSERQLREVINRYQSANYEGIISGKDGNENATKIAESEQHALLRRLLSHANNFDYAQVCVMYNELAANNAWRKVSRRTVENFAKANQLLTEAGRRGEVSFDNRMAMQHKRRNTGYPMLYWTIDGWDAELLYQNTELNKNGHSVTTYHNRPCIVLMLDPFTSYPVGYAIGSHETPELIRSAVRNAINHTADLFGCRYRPRQLQSDHYGGKELETFFEASCGRYTPAKRKNAKSKRIEPHFKTLNKNYCQYYNNWSGFGLTAKVDNQPNTEFKNKIRHSFPDFAGVVDQLEKIMAKERADKHDAYVAKWQELPEEYKLPWTEEQYLLNLGIRKPRTNKLQGEGLCIEIKGNEFTYDSFEVGFRMNKQTNWTVCYDPANMQHVLAINEDASLRFLLEEKYQQSLTLTERSGSDAQELARIDQHNKALKELVLNTQTADYELLEGVFEGDAAVETLSKMLLVDSMGQHKNQRNKAVNAAAKRLAEPAKQLPNPEADLEAKRQEYLKNKIDLNQYLD